MCAPAMENKTTSLAVIRKQGANSLIVLGGQLEAHSSVALLNQYEKLEAAMKNIPDMFLIAIDRSGSGDNDLPIMEKRIREIRTSVGKEDCPVVMFGDANPSVHSRMWDENEKLSGTTLNGDANGHEGGLQAVLWGLQQKGVKLEERDVESPPIHAFILTDEHADGVLGEKIRDDVAKTVSNEQAASIFTAFNVELQGTEGINKKKAVDLDFDVKRSATATSIEAITKKLKDAHVILHVITPKTNLEDYPYSWGDETTRKTAGIYLLGQIWQGIAAMTNGDWADLEEEFTMGGSNLAKTVEDMKQVAIAPIKALLVDNLQQD